MLWPDDLVWQVALIWAVVMGSVSVAGFFMKSTDSGKIGRRISSGFAPTAALAPTFFSLAVLVLVFGPVPNGRYPNGEILLAAVVIALVGLVCVCRLAWQAIDSTRCRARAV